MMHDPIPKGSRADLTPFGFVDEEMAVSTGAILLAEKFILQGDEMIRQMMVKGGGGQSPPFAFGRFVVGFPQVSKRYQTRK